MRKLIVTMLLFIYFGGLACNNESQKSHQADASPQPTPAPQSSSKVIMTGPAVVTSEESARQAAIGVWTNTQPLESWGELEVFLWNRFVFRSDGRFEHYHAKPTDDDWGKPKIGMWKIYSGKYRDTGERYYGVNCSGDSYLKEMVLGTSTGFVFENDQTLQVRDPIGALVIILTKEDNFPFSK